MPTACAACTASAICVMRSSARGLSITATTFILREGPIVRTAMSRDLESLASVLGANSAAALAFRDQKAATELLSALSSVSHVHTAVRPSGVQSAWSTPRQSGTASTSCTCQLCGS